MRFDESAVSLRPEVVEEISLRQDEPVEPRRQLCKRLWEVRRLEDQQRADHLDPGGPGLGTGTMTMSPERNSKSSQRALSSSPDM